MSVTPLTLKANEDLNFPVAGRYLRLLSGVGNITANVLYANGDSYRETLLVGIGYDLRSNSGDGCVAIVFNTDTAQSLQFLVSNFPTTDNRLVGNVQLTGNLQAQPDNGSSAVVGSVPVSANTAVQLLAADQTRVRGLVNIVASGYIGTDNTVSAATGYPVNPQDLIHDSKAALWFFSSTAQTIKTWSDKK